MTQVPQPHERPHHDRIARYGFALLCGLDAFFIRIAFAPLLGPADLPFILAYPAVALVAWIGGLGPAMACALFSGFLLDFVMVGSSIVFHSASRAQMVGLFIFLASSILIGALGERQRRALAKINAEFQVRIEREKELQKKTGELEAAERASSQLVAIVESSFDPMLSKDLSGTVTSWNPAAARTFGYTPDEIVGQSILKIVPKELYPEEHRILTDIAAGGRVEAYETIRLHKNGSEINVWLSISPVFNREGKVIGASTIAHDITERKRAEKALQRTEMEAAKGRLAATIAHEINNPLEAITNIGYLIGMAPELSSGSRELVTALNAEVARVSDITRQALAFYRSSEEPTAVAVNPILEGVIDLFRRRIVQKAARIETDYGESIPRIMVRPGEMRQVVSNLLGNALDAIPDGGKVYLRTRATRERVCITVCDNGHGIPDNRREKIFQPFETTKGEKGTGLGLWVSKGLIEKYGGKILFRSSADPEHKGTSFMVVLPRPVMEKVDAGAA